MMSHINKFEMEGYNKYPSDIIVPYGYFLNDSIPFNYRLVTGFLNEYCEELFYRIYLSNRQYNIENKKIALNNNISNILVAHYNHKCLAVSKNRNTFTLPMIYGMAHYTYTNIVYQIDWLYEHQYINQVRGIYFEDGKKRNTRIWATAKMIDEITDFILKQRIYIPETQMVKQLKYGSPVVLKDDSKKLISYPVNRTTKKMIRFLNEYNEFMDSQEIILPIQNEVKDMSDFLSPYFIFIESIYDPISNYNLHIHTNYNIYNTNNTTITPLLRFNDIKYMYLKDLNAQLYRVFNVSLKRGGRFYGADYQGMSENVRGNILIEGEKIIELDFSSLHLTMLYHQTGINFEGDPYLAINDNLELRSLFKMLSLVIINAGTKRDAVRGFNTEVFKDSQRKTNRRFHKENLEKYNLSFNELYNHFIATHRKLEEYFLSGVGIRLQYLDSQIAENVMMHCLRANIPCLCIHDSFIVPEKYRSELEITMQEAYKKVMKTKYQIIIK